MSKDWREDASKRLKEKQQKGRFKLSEGDNIIRILPNAKGEDIKPFYEGMVHYGVGPKGIPVRCGKNIHGEGKCWLCDKQIPKLAESKSKANRRMAEEMAAKEQFVVQVAVFDADSEKFSGPFVWFVSSGGAKSLAARLLGVMKSSRRDIISPAKGYNITIERTGTGKKDTAYGAPVVDEERSKVPSGILARLKPFSELIKSYSLEAQKAAFFGREEEEEPEDDDDDAAATGADADDSGDDDSDEPKKKKKGSKKSEDDSGDDDSDSDSDADSDSDDDSGDDDDDASDSDADSDSDDDSGDDDGSKKKKKGPKKKTDDDDDDSDSDADSDSDDSDSDSNDDDSDSDADSDSDDDSGDDDDDGSKKKKKGSKKSRASDDDDNDSGEDDDSGDDDDDGSKKKKKGADKEERTKKKKHRY